MNLLQKSKNRYRIFKNRHCTYHPSVLLCDVVLLQGRGGRVLEQRVGLVHLGYGAVGHHGPQEGALELPTLGPVLQPIVRHEHLVRKNKFFHDDRGKTQQVFLQFSIFDETQQCLWQGISHYHNSKTAIGIEWHSICGNNCNLLFVSSKTSDVISDQMDLWAFHFNSVKMIKD